MFARDRSGALTGWAWAGSLPEGSDGNDSNNAVAAGAREGRGKEAGTPSSSSSSSSSSPSALLNDGSGDDGGEAMEAIGLDSFVRGAIRASRQRWREEEKVQVFLRQQRIRQQREAAEDEAEEGEAGERDGWEEEAARRASFGREGGGGGVNEDSSIEEEEEGMGRVMPQPAGSYDEEEDGGVVSRWLKQRPELQELMEQEREKAARAYLSDNLLR